YSSPGLSAMGRTPWRCLSVIATALAFRTATTATALVAISTPLVLGTLFRMRRCRFLTFRRLTRRTERLSTSLATSLATSLTATAAAARTPSLGTALAFRKRRQGCTRVEQFLDITP